MSKQSAFCNICKGNKRYIQFHKDGAIWVCDNCGEEGKDHIKNPNQHERKLKEVQL